MKKIPLSRRDFISGTTASAIAINFIPGSILGLNGATPPSEKVNIAAIGISGQGRGDIRQFKSHNIVALCDVDWRHAAGTFQEYPNAKQYKDFRVMLDEQKDIDAVIVATPDHVHAFASMAAMQRGKHVYCEKPLTHSVWEARQLTEFVRKRKLATQMGNQGQASDSTRRLSEMVAEGAAGKVTEVHIWTDRPANGLFGEYWPQGVSRPKESPSVPDTMAWDLWLGPAPARPYNPAYAPFKWRGWWDFGTGALGDIGCHTFDPVFRALKLGAPLSVQATSTRVNEETYPLGSMVTYEFPAGGQMPALKLVWYDGGLRPARPQGLPEGTVMGANGSLLLGNQGIILNSNLTNWRLYRDSKPVEFTAKNPIASSPGHYQEWINAILGGKPAGSNFEWAGPLTETVLLGNVALRPQIREQLTKIKLLWDPAKLEFPNFSEANRFLKREYREGWSLS